MLRFISNEKTSLLNYVFSIKVVEDENKEYVADVNQMYPNAPPDNSIIKSIKLFAFPDRAAIESRCFFTFVIGNTSTEFQLGFIYYYTYFDAYCVLSDYYYPSIFKHYMTLDRKGMRDYCIELTKNIYSLNGVNTVKINNTVYKLDGSVERQRLTKLIFTTFPAFDISKIIIGMLTARHIFIVAGNASTCSLFAASIPLLIEPFYWDLNLIPILPIKIKDMIDVPVPAMIGVTRSEYLVKDSIAPHVCVNADTKHVLDFPVFEAANANLRIQVINKQLEFHNTINKILQDWSGCPGFPHHQILHEVQNFIGKYLIMYTGTCPSSADFIKAASNNFPEYLKNSQITDQLFILNDLKDSQKKAFQNFFCLFFAKDAANKMMNKKTGNMAISNSNKNNQETINNENNTQRKIETTSFKAHSTSDIFQNNNNNDQQEEFHSVNSANPFKHKQVTELQNSVHSEQHGNPFKPQQPFYEENKSDQNQNISDHHGNPFKQTIPAQQNKFEQEQHSNPFKSFRQTEQLQNISQSAQYGNPFKQQQQSSFNQSQQQYPFNQFQQQKNPFNQQQSSLNNQSIQNMSSDKFSRTNSQQIYHKNNDELFDIFNKYNSKNNCSGNNFQNPSNPNSNNTQTQANPFCSNTQNQSNPFSNNAQNQSNPFSNNLQNQQNPFGGNQQQESSTNIIDDLISF